MYKKEITTYEHVYTEDEQKRLEEIQMELKRLLASSTLSTGKMEKLVDEMGDIITGVWSPPMPF